MEDVLQGLNEEQKQAVTTTEGYIRVIAGAGSGKTRALTHRYAYLVNELGISPSNILCVTFTNKAANEMKNRIKRMIGDMDCGYVCTFHGMGVNILREDIHVIKYPSNFVVMDTEDTEQILKTIYEANNINRRVYTFKNIRKYIRVQKSSNKFDYISSYIMNLDNRELKEKYERELDIEEKIYLGYLYEQKKNYGLDYDDLIFMSLYILAINAEKRKKWQERMMYVMVDEYQDVNQWDWWLADILSGYHKNLFIVGDPNQTIYTWRGSNIKYILEFDKKHNDTNTLRLYKNYRSTPEVINAANSLISKNTVGYPNPITSMRESGIMPVYCHSKTTKNEAFWIVNKIRELVETGVNYSDIALLYRSHFVSRSLEEVFLNEKIPYILFSGIEFYKRKEIKDVLAYLRMIIYQDDLSFQRIVNEPKRQIGKQTIAFLTEYADKNDCSLYNALKENLDHTKDRSAAESFVNMVEKYSKIYKEMKLSDIFTGILNDSGYDAMLRMIGEEERLENLAELKESIFEFEKTSGEDNTLEEYLQSIALYTNSDSETRKNAVKLMTIHIAKGLEFPYVFLCGFNERIFPTQHALSLPKMEEERRLAYVAYTSFLYNTKCKG